MSGINEENDIIPLFLCELSSLEYRLAYSSLYILVFNFGLPTVRVSIMMLIPEMCI